MIKIVDKNGDGKISYSEFRVMMGAFPLLIPEDWISVLLYNSLSFLKKSYCDVVFNKMSKHIKLFYILNFLLDFKGGCIKQKGRPN